MERQAAKVSSEFAGSKELRRLHALEVSAAPHNQVLVPGSSSLSPFPSPLPSPANATAQSPAVMYQSSA